MTGQTSPSKSCDVAIIGAGLAGGLITLALAGKRPDLNVILLDGADHAGGNHVWSFFDSDMSAAGRTLLAPLVSHRWGAGYEVRFPAYRRHIDMPYNSIQSRHFDRHLRSILGENLWLGDAVEHAGQGEIRLASGKAIRCGTIIDARGFAPPFCDEPSGTKSSFPDCDRCDPAAYSPAGGYIARSPASDGAGLFLDTPHGPIECGWQKFVGQALELAAPHGLNSPIVMDATVDQGDGYRFVYVLPLDARRIFIEDTYYTDGPELDIPSIRSRITAYATEQGWAAERVAHEETGVLPVVKRGTFETVWPRQEALVRAGVRAGLFHPTTGYSLPMATEYALALADHIGPDYQALRTWARGWAQSHWRGAGYYRLLSTMLFDAAPPHERYRIFERFYRLPSHLISRFYSGQSTYLDKIRILCGKPPVPIRAALKAIMSRKRA